MADKKSWNAIKKDLWQMDVGELQKKLQELNNQRYKDEAKARGYSGDLRVPMHCGRVSNSHESSVNLKVLRHRIACIKTMLHVKLGPVN